jgi:1,4-alpha-glucan branching enzyme
LQAAAQGGKTDMDALMGNILKPEGFNQPETAVTIISDHDEVAIGGRTITIAENGQADRPPTIWERGAARAAFGIGMFSPGMPMFFQGEESLAKNTFKWGVPSTWDTGWDWKKKNFDVAAAAEATSRGQEAQFAAADPSGVTPEDIYRRLHFQFCKAAIALRKSSPAFDANVPATRVYTHNDNSVMAFTRKSGDDEFLVVSSFNHNAHGGYGIPLEPGKWQLVLNSDATDFGGSGLGQPTVEGGPQARLDLPAGAVMVYKKV